MFFDLLALAWGNMRRARLRLLMTLAGVIVATATVMILIALTIGLQNVAEGSIGSDDLLTEIVVMPSIEPLENGDILRLDDEAVARFQNLSGVATVFPILNFNRRVEFRADDDLLTYAPVIGVPADAIAAMNFSLQNGTSDLGTEQAIVGANFLPNFADLTAENIEFVSINPDETTVSMVLSIGFEEELLVPLTISGELESDTSRFDNSVFISLADALNYRTLIRGEERDEALEFDLIILRTSNRQSMSQVREQLQEIGYEIDTVGSLLDDINAFFSSLRLVMGLTGGIALLVSAIVVTNTMMMTVLERTSEIGLMKAIGARDRDVLLIFLFEAGLVGLVGGFIGMILAFIASDNINQYVRDNAGNGASAGFLPINTALLAENNLLVMPQNLILIGVLIAISICVVAGFFPAWRASRLSPVTALRN